MMVEECVGDGGGVCRGVCRGWWRLVEVSVGDGGGVCRGWWSSL